MRFDVGSDVTWRSHSSGVWSEKTGTVVAQVPAQTDPRTEFSKLPGSGALKFHYHKGKPRTHQSYLVRVGEKDVYWPTTSALSLTGEPKSALEAQS